MLTRSSPRSGGVPGGGACRGAWTGVDRVQRARCTALAAPGRKPDDAFFDDLLEVLIGADCGVELSERLVVALRAAGPPRADRRRRGGDRRAQGGDPRGHEHLRPPPQPQTQVPSVVLVVGVNGSGKTTTLGKLAHRLREEGRTALIAAADTYRAAAIDQMRVWADRAGTDVVAHQPGADPGAVVFDAIQAAQARRDRRRPRRHRRPPAHQGQPHGRAGQDPARHRAR